MRTNLEDKKAMPVTVEEMYERLEERTAVRRRLKLPEARTWLARMIGVSPGTLESLRRNRLKDTDQLEKKINGAWVKHLEAEIAALTHELEMARQRGLRPDADEILAAETCLAQARKLLGMA